MKGATAIYRVRTDMPGYPGSATDQMMTADELRSAHPWVSALGELEEIHEIGIVTLAPSRILIEHYGMTN